MGSLISIYLEQGCFAGQLQGTRVVVVLVMYPCAPKIGQCYNLSTLIGQSINLSPLIGHSLHSPVYEVGDHLLALLPHGAPEGGVPLPVPRLGVRPVVEQMTHTVQLPGPRRADQGSLSPDIARLINVF